MLKIRQNWRVRVGAGGRHAQQVAGGASVNTVGSRIGTFVATPLAVLRLVARLYVVRKVT